MGHRDRYMQRASLSRGFYIPPSKLNRFLLLHFKDRYQKKPDRLQQYKKELQNDEFDLSDHLDDLESSIADVMNKGFEVTVSGNQDGDDGRRCLFDYFRFRIATNDGYGCQRESCGPATVYFHIHNANQEFNQEFMGAEREDEDEDEDNVTPLYDEECGYSLEASGRDRCIGVNLPISDEHMQKQKLDEEGLQALEHMKKVFHFEEMAFEPKFVWLLGLTLG